METTKAPTREQATKSIPVLPNRHRQLKHLAVDRDLNLIEVTDQVIAAGLAAIRQTLPASVRA